VFYEQIKSYSSMPRLSIGPMGRMANVKDIVEAVLYLSQAGQATGEVLHVDGGAHAGRW
jgi:NAD(P)-dependent dehydrogenase (short-subunit alcohol dehydrogenase family)